MSDARRLAAIVATVAPAALAALGGALACEPQKAGTPDAGPSESAPSAVESTAPKATAESPSAHAARWEEARNAALRIPCRAIAVDGPVRVEGADAGALALQSEIPDQTWLSLGPDARLVAKDPRTTRETAFVGPARVRSCVAHREESWLAAGRFESAIGAGETPGAEEWVVTPLGVVRYTPWPARSPSRSARRKRGWPSAVGLDSCGSRTASGWRPTVRQERARTRTRARARVRRSTTMGGYG